MIELAGETILVCQRCDVENLYAEPLRCRGCGASLVTVGDGLPTMGEESDSELSKWQCQCGHPAMPGFLHRADGPCRFVGTAHEF